MDSTLFTLNSLRGTATALPCAGYSLLYTSLFLIPYSLFRLISLTALLHSSSAGACRTALRCCRSMRRCSSARCAAACRSSNAAALFHGTAAAGRRGRVGGAASGRLTWRCTSTSCSDCWRSSLATRLRCSDAMLRCA